MDAAKASHPHCVEWNLKHGNGKIELFRRSYARLPKPLHKAAGATPTRSGYHVSTRNKPACTLCVEAMLAFGADTSWRDEGGRSPLQRAAKVGVSKPFSNRHAPRGGRSVRRPLGGFVRSCEGQVGCGGACVDRAHGISICRVRWILNRVRTRKITHQVHPNRHLPAQRELVSSPALHGSGLRKSQWEVWLEA